LIPTAPKRTFMRGIHASGGSMSENPGNTSSGKSGNWGKLALMNGAVAAWLLYDISTATEEPSRAVVIMQYVFLAGASIGLAASLVKLMSAKQ
jgi:hypothetical protein